MGDLPNEKPVAHEDIEAAPLKANFDNLNGRVQSIEGQITNLASLGDVFDNGCFEGGLVASQVSTALSYTVGGLICNHTYYYKATLSVDFSGYGADTYYVEVDSAGLTDIYTGLDPARTNLNTVVWNGSGFDSVTEADRNLIYGDDQFVVLAGRSGGQIINGGIAASEDLELKSTSHGTKGSVKVRDAAIQNKLTTQTTATLTLDDSHSIVACDTNANGITLTLPDASGVLGQEYTIFVTNVTSGNDVTVNADGADTFIHEDGVEDTTITMTENDYVVIRAVANNKWLVVVDRGAVYS